MTIKRVGLIAGVLALAVLTSGCNVGTAVIGTRIDPGSVGLLVDNYGSEKGIEGAELFTGGKVTYNNFTHELYEYPVFFKTYKFEKPKNGESDDRSVRFSISGSPASMDLGVTYRFRYDAVEAEKPKYTHLHEFFRNYRVSPDEFNNGALQNALRDCANIAASGANPVEIATKPASFQAPLLECLADKFPQIEIKEVSLLNPPSLPETIQESINRSFQAQQDAQTAVANKSKAEAEAAANVATATGKAQVRIVEAKAEAEANGIINGSLTDRLIELQRIENERARIEKWNGQMAPTVQTPNVQLGAPAATPPQ